MTQAALYALVKQADFYMFPSRWSQRNWAEVQPRLRALGIYGKRTLRAKLRAVDAWRRDVHPPELRFTVTYRAWCEAEAQEDPR